MQAIILLVMAAVMAVVAASITATAMRNGPPALTFKRAFDAAYPAWFAAFFGVFIVYAFYVNILRLRTLDVPGILLLAILVAGGWGAAILVRSARQQTGA